MQILWTVDYGKGLIPVELPHVWHMDAPVTWEGPAVYRCKLAVPSGQSYLLFHGVSYEASISVQGEPVTTHCGIWDAFFVELSRWAGLTAEIAVSVIKNGGPTLPVRKVASGFLPYVFHTFGGIFRSVELHLERPELEPPAPRVAECRFGGGILLDGEPFYARGILTWGWYPETASPNPTKAVVREEVAYLKDAGFNLVKFCLWLPPHVYLEELDRQEMLAWMELPMWLPSTEPVDLERMRSECLNAVAQYRRHPNILAWTAGCELGSGIPPGLRKALVADIQRLTGHPLVKDNSGGAELYGGHPAEFGTFNDFHPYCEPMFFPLVLDSLRDGPRETMPTLLGEFNDYDGFRPVHLWNGKAPYWALPDPELNDQGVRWQYDLPDVLRRCAETDLGSWLAARGEELESSSLSQAAWMRRHAFDSTRAEASFDGWVLTGHRHTPISTSGVVDDVGEPVFGLGEVNGWTADTVLFLVARRAPPFVEGGNRPGWEHPRVRFAGPCMFQVAVHSVRSEKETLNWAVEGMAEGRCPPKGSKALEPSLVGSFVVELEPGNHRLSLSWGDASREELIQIVARRGAEEPTGLDRLVLLEGPMTLSRPFFREACYAWDDPVWSRCGWRDNWDKLSLVAGDRVIDPAWLDSEHPGWSPLLTRLDTRTFERHPVAVLVRSELLTTLRPQGGLGFQPIEVSRNPAGLDLLRLFRSLH